MVTGHHNETEPNAFTALLECTHAISALLEDTSNKLDKSRTRLSSKVETFYCNRHLPRKSGASHRHTTGNHKNAKVKRQLRDIHLKRCYNRQLQTEIERLRVSIIEERKKNDELSRLKEEYIEARIDLGLENTDAMERYIRRSKESDQSGTIGWTKFSSFNLTDEERYDLAVVVVHGRENSSIFSYQYVN